MNNCWESLWTNNSFSRQTHVQLLRKKAGQKLHALSRISYCLERVKLKHITRAFTISQFSYYHLVCMFYETHLDNKIGNIHKRTLNIA